MLYGACFRADLASSAGNAQCDVLLVLCSAEHKAAQYYTFPESCSEGVRLSLRDKLQPWEGRPVTIESQNLMWSFIG